MHTSSKRTVVTLVLVGALVLTAGCSALGLDGGDAGATATAESQATDIPEESENATETARDEQSESSEGEESPDDDHDHSGHDHGDSDDGDSGTGDGSENGTATEAGTMNASSAAASGKMTIAVNGSELDLPARDRSGDEFGVANSDEHTWAANETGLTLAEALSRFDVEASASQVAIDGERYRQQTNGTALTYRVNGEPVDPEAYVLEDGDQVWITVGTAETNVSGPGTYIRAAQQHAHGDMTFVVDGEEVDFSEEKYQSNHRYFHYENGGGEEWHAHSVTLTLDYALSSLAGIDVTDDAIEYNGTTYDAGDNGTSIDVTVNGDPVDPGGYVLKDGDSVRVVIESEG